MPRITIVGCSGWPEEEARWHIYKMHFLRHKHRNRLNTKPPSALLGSLSFSLPHASTMSYGFSVPWCQNYAYVHSLRPSISGLDLCRTFTIMKYRRRRQD